MNLIRYLLKRKKVLNAFIEVQNDCTSLHWACQEGFARTAEFLISAGANIEAMDKVIIYYRLLNTFLRVYAREDSRLFFLLFWVDIHK